MRQEITKQDIQKTIDMITDTNKSSVALFTANESYVALLEEKFPDIKIHLVPEDYLPDSNVCYIVPIKSLISLTPTLFEEKTDERTL